MPFALIGFAGALSGPTFDVAVAAGGDAVAIRGADGALSVFGARPSPFDAEQWLRADADGRDPKSAILKTGCDKLGCIGHLADGRAVSIVLDPAGFAEDCLRAVVVVSPLFAPRGCAATVLDRPALKITGAVTLQVTPRGFRTRTARSRWEDRPWSPAPARPWAIRAHSDAAKIDDQ